MKQSCKPPAPSGQYRGRQDCSTPGPGSQGVHTVTGVKRAAECHCSPQSTTLAEWWPGSCQLSLPLMLWRASEEPSRSLFRLGWPSPESPFPSFHNPISLWCCPQLLLLRGIGIPALAHAPLIFEASPAHLFTPTSGSMHCPMSTPALSGHRELIPKRPTSMTQLP